MQHSILYNEQTFYKQFIDDLLHAKHEVIIESPFITSNRMETLSPIFETLLAKEIEITLVTKYPGEHDEEFFRDQATEEILSCVEMGVNVQFVDGLHRKTAIIDREILYEGSLNILSQNNSREIMRRIDDKDEARKLLKFLKVF
ncbi:hypothetical protein HGA88_01865 [Candidatus Roizmanbacteria bacterium]|nr:hypothetical protein [Candidatus Roizmanbacteria bacterium]